MERTSITIYTDGSCRNNGKQNASAGFGCILVFKDKEKVIRGRITDNPTNNRAELTAVIEAVKSLKKPCKIQLITDSEYVSSGIMSFHNWKDRGWKSMGGSQIKNIDLWESLYNECVNGKHIIDKEKLQVIKGHNGNSYNERCDTIAKEMSKA